MDRVIEVEIDGLLTPVDAEDWGSDPDAVIELVRDNRAAPRLQAD